MQLLIFIFIYINLHLEALVWSKPIDISNNSSDDVSLAVDGYGNAIAVWISGETNNFVYSSIKPLGSEWSPPVQISLLPTNNPPAIAMNPSGYAMAAWIAQDGSNNLIQSTTVFFGGTWSTPVTLSDPSVSQQSVSIGIDDSGNAIVIWTFNNGSKDLIQVGNIPYLGSCSVTTLSSNLVSSGVPSISVNASGNAVAAWTSYSGVDFNGYTQASRYLSNVWSAADTLTSVTDQSYNPVALIDSSSNATVAWYKQVSDPSLKPPYLLQYATCPFGGSWSSITSLDSQITGPPSLVATSTDTVIMIWSQYQGSNEISSLIRSTTIPLGSSSTPTVTVSLPGDTAYSFDLAIDSSNNAYAVWNTNPYSSSASYAKTATLPFEESWTKPFIISDDSTGSIIYPVIASHLSNEAVIAWSYLLGSSEIVQATTGTSLQAPLLIYGDQTLHRFPTQGDLINSLSWIPPHTHGIDRYRIYRTTLSNLIGEVSTPNFQDHQRMPSIPYTYFVTALTAGDEESAAGTIIIP